ncbi:hypothetical protein [Flavobacterium sp.]|uniref:hypothetical protein n=1 Tax=Flavobacterium sp. TaxID=239 RepID=UPI0025C2563E|nr:hypothetical protein [Flavobacterium sp.]MBA4155561.1 hypothetical protein [Flavobacterium sp.]
MEQFGWAFDNEIDMSRTFNELHNFHDKAVPESTEKIQSLYAKIFKSNAFYLIAPILYLYLKYLATKYTHPEYLNKIIENEIQAD